jgi:hypothetical protein
MFGNLFGIFSRKDDAIEELLRTAEQIRADLNSRTLLFANQCVDDYIAFVKKWTPELIADFRQAVQKARNERGSQNPDASGFGGSNADLRQWVYKAMMQQTARKVTSGNLHIYRGVLGIEGVGTLEVFSQCVTNMVAIGAFTEEWARENWRNPVAQAVREAG